MIDLCGSEVAIVKKSDVIYGGIYLLCNSIILISILVLFKYNDLNMFFSCFAVIQGLSSILLLKKKYTIFSLAPLFVILSEIFHFGEAFILAIGRDELVDISNVTLSGNIRVYNEANVFAFMIQAFVVFGMLLSIKKKRKISIFTSVKSILMKGNNIAISVALITAVFGFIPTAIYYLKMATATINGISYAGIREASDIGPFSFFSVLYEPGIFALIIALSINNKKRLAKMVFVMACAFEVFCMITGNRGTQITRIIVYVYLYFKFIEKPQMSRIVLCSIAGYVGVAFMYYVSMNRLTGMGNMSIQNFMKSMGFEPILGLIAQQGSTLNVVCLTIRDVPSYTPFVFGTQYLASLVNAFPGTSYWAGNLPNMAGTLSYLDTTLPLGDSYIAELYHNFGWLSLLVAPLIGRMIGQITISIEDKMSREQCLECACYLVAFRGILWVVRSNLFSFLFNYIWGTIGLALVTLGCLNFLKVKNAERVTR